MAYYGDERHGGVNGHFYHVFGTVRRVSLDRYLPYLDALLLLTHRPQPLYYRIPADLPAEGNATESAAAPDAGA